MFLNALHAGFTWTLGLSGGEGQQGYYLAHQYAKSLSRQRYSYLCEQIGMTRLFRAEQPLTGITTTQQPMHLVWFGITPAKISAFLPTFLSVVYAITSKQSISLLTPERRFNPLRPYQLIYREGQWYLLANTTSKCMFVVEDIQQVQPLNTPSHLNTQ